MRCLILVLRLYIRKMYVCYSTSCDYNTIVCRSEKNTAHLYDSSENEICIEEIERIHLYSMRNVERLS
ncbi:hypothetical protein IAD21_06409 (plasmid) [Abditibacteriota bacterium]|nr:hypothetical protein IAD21_06409 [Abditibacteriota bacterium]